MYVRHGTGEVIPNPNCLNARRWSCRRHCKVSRRRGEVGSSVHCCALHFVRRGWYVRMSPIQVQLVHLAAAAFLALHFLHASGATASSDDTGDGAPNSDDAYYEGEPRGLLDRPPLSFPPMRYDQATYQCVFFKSPREGYVARTSASSLAAK
jgi:hypothetical protein